MAKIVILMGRASSGKTRTINKIGGILDLTRKPRQYPGFITWGGQAKESNTEVLVVAQTGSLQEKMKGDLEGTKQLAQEWIDFLDGKNNTLAIIPLTLMGGSRMSDLILRPLELFRNSQHEVKTVYLKKDKTNQEYLVTPVIGSVNPDLTIRSVKGNEERQAHELLAYLNLQLIPSPQLASIEKFF